MEKRTFRQSGEWQNRAWQSERARRRYRSGKCRGFGRKAGKTLIRQTILCLIIVLLAITIKKMDAAMSGEKLAAVQTLMSQEYSLPKASEAASKTIQTISSLPAVIEKSVEKSQSENRYLEPCDGEALVMTFGGNASAGSYSDTYSGLRYSSESELQVYASSGGTVLSVEGEPGNQRIRISHGGEVESQYAGCCSVYVEPLQKVRKGELIASVTPGDESCLTFSMWKDGESVDPTDYIRF